DRQILIDFCEQAWAPPPRPAPPPSLRLTYGRSASLDLDQTGIRLNRDAAEAFCAWSEVKRVVVIRQERCQPGFLELKLELPAETISIRGGEHRGAFGTIWKGTDDETLVAFLRGLAPAERFMEVSLGGRPWTLEQADYVIEYVAANEARGQTV